MIAKILIDDYRPQAKTFYGPALKGYRHEFQLHWLPRGESVFRATLRLKPHLIVLRTSFYGERDVSDLKSLVNHPKTRHIPIIAIGEGGAPINMSAHWEDWADDFMTEPLDPKGFLARIYHYLRKQGLRSTPQDDNEALQSLGIGTLRIIRKGKIMIDSQSVSLGGKEFLLLTILLSRPNHYWSRDDLWVSLWNSDVKKFNKHAMEDCVSRLRRNLGPKWRPCLVFDPALGYCLDVRLAQEMDLRKQPVSPGPADESNGNASLGENRHNTPFENQSHKQLLDLYEKRLIIHDRIRDSGPPPLPKLSNLQCIKILRLARWPLGPQCPFCSGQEVRVLARHYSGGCRRYFCHACSRLRLRNITFTDKTGTIFRANKTPLNHLFYLLYVYFRTPDYFKIADLQEPLKATALTIQRLMRRLRRLLSSKTG